MFSLHGKYLSKSDYTQGRRRCLHPFGSLVCHRWEKCLGPLFWQRRNFWLFTSQKSTKPLFSLFGIIRRNATNSHQCDNQPHSWVSHLFNLVEIILPVLPLKPLRPTVFDAPEQQKGILRESKQHFHLVLTFLYRPWLSKMFSSSWTYSNEWAARVKSCNNLWFYFINSFLGTNCCDESRSNKSEAHLQRSGDYIVNVSLEGNYN